MNPTWGGPPRITRGGPPPTRRSEERLGQRVRAQWRTLRDNWAGAGRWVRVRRLVLPALLAWSLATEVHSVATGIEVAVVVAALLIRFTLPATALLLGVAMVTAPPTAAVVVPVFAYAAARRIAEARRAVPVFAVATVVVGANVAIRTAGLPLTIAVSLTATAVAIALIVPGAVGALAGERARRLDALRERNDILERAYRLGDQQARLQERTRIAGEMHDLIGHRLSLISLHAGALELGTRSAAPELSEQATLVRGTARTALDELRQVLGILKLGNPSPATEGHGDDAGTRADVSALVLASQRAGVPVELDWVGADLATADGRVRRAVHRVVREALTNVHKHAPGAIATVRVEHDAETVHVEVRSELPARPGTSAPGTGMGLVGLAERVRLVGGTIRTGPSFDRTVFVVAALLPVVPAGDPAGATTTIDQPGLDDRQTSPTPPGGDSAPHTGSPTRGSTHVMGRTAKIVLLSIAGLVVLCCGGGLIGVKFFIAKAKAASISPATFDAIQIGQAEADVRRRMPAKDSIAKDSLGGQEPPVPAGSKCAYALSSATVTEWSPTVYRFCFADGRLVEKRAITAPSPN